jgi:hypothetical protein
MPSVLMVGDGMTIVVRHRHGNLQRRSRSPRQADEMRKSPGADLHVAIQVSPDRAYLSRPPQVGYRVIPGPMV